MVFRGAVAQSVTRGFADSPSIFRAGNCTRPTRFVYSWGGSRYQAVNAQVIAVAGNLNRRGCRSTDSTGGVTMAKDAWKRPTYEAKTIEQASSPRWAWGCDKCRFGTVNGTVNEFCTCQAGQAKRRWATGQMVQDDDVHVPTFNAAYQ